MRFFPFLFFLSSSLALQLSLGSSPFNGQPIQNAQPNTLNIDDAKDWTEQPLCILQATGRCPSGFTYKELRLSTQPDDRNIAGEELMHLGNAGDSSLLYDQYDRLYTLTLSVCCKT